MRLKIKTHILLLSCLWAALLWAPALSRAGESLKDFSGNEKLRQAIWRLGAFVPAAAGDAAGALTLIDGIEGLAPVAIKLSYAEPLDPWPQALSLTFKAEDSPPRWLVLADSRPFGGPNLSLNYGQLALEAGLSGSPAEIFLDILQRLNQRLMRSRPSLGPVKWLEHEKGFEAARVELLYGARFGPADLFLARFDPTLFALKPYHESEFPLEPQANIALWAQRLPQAAALINAGQYYPDRSYMGSLFRDGQSLSSGPHSQWKGLVVSGPGPEAPAGAPEAALLDLLEAPADWRPEHYQNQMQSFMMLDAQGRVRVRDSQQLASRAALGQDKQGRLILIMTPAAVSLYDLAVALKNSSLDLTRVLGLDGGFEAQLLLRQGDRPFQASGRFSISPQRWVYVPGYRPALPAVLAVERKAPPEEAPREPDGGPEPAAKTP